MELEHTNSPSPKDHARNIEEILSSLKALCRSELQVFEDPKAKALLETTAEVLGGLERAFNHFRNKDEDAWKDDVREFYKKSSDPWD